MQYKFLKVPCKKTNYKSWGGGDGNVVEPGGGDGGGGGATGGATGGEASERRLGGGQLGGRWLGGRRLGGKRLGGRRLDGLFAVGECTAAAPQ